MYADYIIPDLHYLERWEFQGSHPNMPVKVQPIRQPVIASPNEVVKVFGVEQPISYETFWLALAEKLGLKGFGKDGFGPGQDFTRPDDFYIRMVANIAFDGKDPVADASPAEIELFKRGETPSPEKRLRSRTLAGHSRSGLAEGGYRSQPRRPLRQPVRHLQR